MDGLLSSGTLNLLLLGRLVLGGHLKLIDGGGPTQMSRAFYTRAGLRAIFTLEIMRV